MTETKRPTTIAEQIAILKDHGCIISDSTFAEEILSTINYYRVSAYFLPFRNEDRSFLSDTTFEKIYRIYEFDRELRSLLFSAIESIEIALRARLSYLHGLRYGALGYLDSANFNARHNTDRFLENIQREITSNRNVPFVQHHQQKYHGYFPVWVITELFTFGMLSYFYSDLLTQDQKAIARQYNTSHTVLKSWLRCCTDARNICAHYGRLYYRVFSAAPAGFNFSAGIRWRMWAVMLVIKALYPSPQKWSEEFVPRAEKLFQKYADDIDLYHLGFPRDWKAHL